MPEIVIPAYTPEAVQAAVQNGADAVYTRFEGFADSEREAAVRYCRERGAKLYYSLDHFVTDADFRPALDRAAKALEQGVHAVETADLGLLKALRTLFPSAKLHLGLNAGIHNLAGAATAAFLGADRVILSSDLKEEELQKLAKEARLELELVCHGPVCTAAPGTCRLAAFTGGDAACFTDCPMPCRRSYTLSSRPEGIPLSRKELCMAGPVAVLKDSGLTAFRVLGGWRRPEYAALTARVYSAAARGEAPAEGDLLLLEKAFAPAGMNEGLYAETEARELFAKQQDQPRHPQALLSGVKGGYMNGEAKRVPVRLFAYLRRGEALRVAAKDEEGHVVYAAGPVPTAAAAGLNAAEVKTQLFNIGVSPFYCTDAACALDPGLSLPSRALADVRDEALAALTRSRAAFTAPERGALGELRRPIEPEEAPEINLFARSHEQLSAALAGLKPGVLYFPLQELLEHPRAILPFWENGATEICVVLPPLIHDGKEAELYRSFTQLREMGVRQVMVSNLGQVFPAAAAGFSVRADMGMNAFNSYTLRALKELKLSSVTLPPELSFEDMRLLAKCLPVEAVLYGRVPVMHTEACLIKAVSGVCSCTGVKQLRDRRSVYPLARCYDCRSTLYSQDKLFLAPLRKEYERLGLSAIRLDFTTENADECVRLMQRFLGQNRYEPSARTRGMYV